MSHGHAQSHRGGPAAQGTSQDPGEARTGRQRAVLQGRAGLGVRRVSARRLPCDKIASACVRGRTSGEI